LQGFFGQDDAVGISNLRTLVSIGIIITFVIPYFLSSDANIPLPPFSKGFLKGERVLEKDKG